MDIRTLQYFTVCAEQGSFSKAAELLYTSQPHVSMVIRSLEQELGTNLFVRKGRGVVLTESGAENYRLAVGILKNVQLMQAESHMERRRKYSILTNPSSNMAVLFSRFYARHQDCYYRYIEEGVETIISMIATQEAEMGFVFVPSNKMNAFHYMLERRHLHYESLTDSDMVVYVGKNNKHYGRSFFYPEELVNLQFVQNIDDYFSFQDLLDNNLPQTSLQVMANNVIETNSSHTMIQMLENTDLCNLCSYWLKNRYKYYDFQMIPVKGFEKKITFGCITKEDGVLSDLGQEYLEYVKQVIAEE